MVVVDDAHLADADSLRALLFCARRLTESATLFVLIARGSALEALPEGWLKLADDAVLRPRSLTAEEARALGGELGVALNADAARRLVEHTGGNPLHLRAVLRELPATRQLAARRPAAAGPAPVRAADRHALPPLRAGRRVAAVRARGARGARAVARWCCGSPTSTSRW